MWVYLHFSDNVQGHPLVRYFHIASKSRLLQYFVNSDTASLKLYVMQTKLRLLLKKKHKAFSHCSFSREHGRPSMTQSLVFFSLEPV